MLLPVELAKTLGPLVSVLELGLVYSWFFLAMAHHRLEHRSEAEEWFDNAMRWTNDEIPELDQDGRVSWPVSWATRATVRLLHDEARALL